MGFREGSKDSWETKNSVQNLSLKQQNADAYQYRIAHLLFKRNNITVFIACFVAKLILLDLNIIWELCWPDIIPWNRPIYGYH